MSENSPSHRSLSPAQMLDLLLDALLERQASRAAGGLAHAAAPRPEPSMDAAEAERPPAIRPAKQPIASVARKETKRAPASGEPGPGDQGWEPPSKVPTIVPFFTCR